MVHPAAATWQVAQLRPLVPRFWKNGLLVSTGALLPLTMVRCVPVGLLIESVDSAPAASSPTALSSSSAQLTATNGAQSVRPSKFIAAVRGVAIDFIQSSFGYGGA